MPGLNISGTTIFWLVFAFFITIWVLIGIRKVQEGYVRLVERFGKYHKTLRPGINFVLPGIDRIKTDFELSTYHTDPSNIEEKIIFPISHKPTMGNINIQEQMMDPGKFDTIAADNAVVHPDIITYFTIIDAHKAVYKVDNLGNSLLKLIETTIRQEIGTQTSDELITARQQIGINVQRALEKATEGWGTRINRVEIQEITFDKGLQDNLVKQREAELVKRGEVVTAQQEKEVMILNSEGIKQAQILEAEGKKQAQILEAEGKFEAQRLEAEAKFLLESKQKEGEAKGMKAISDALKENPEALIILDALQAQAKVAQSIGSSNNALIIPSETAGLFGVIGSIKETISLMNNGLIETSQNGKKENANTQTDEKEI